MDGTEILELKKQYEEVLKALESDPENGELLEMKTELLELISLNDEVNELEQVENPNLIPNNALNKELNGIRVGDKVMAQWEVDKLYYKAVVNNISDDNTKFVLTFLGYGKYLFKRLFFFLYYLLKTFTFFVSLIKVTPN